MRRIWVVLVVLAPLGVLAHVGVQIAIPKFTSPPGPSIVTSDDGGIAIEPAYAAAAADQQYVVQWKISNGADPTGRLEFYYLDHQPPSQVTVDKIPGLATAIPAANGANSEWISCDCNPDAGVMCPDAGDRHPHCNNLSFTWDTSAVPTGVYWVIALNNDPPTQIYATSLGPVRVAHGGAAAPPAVVVVRPDGIGAIDKVYRTLWTVDGTPPYKMDLYYGINDPADVLSAPLPLALNLQPIVNSDGTFSYDWDVSQLPEGLYYLRVNVTDATGQSSFSDSFLGVSVYHQPVMANDGGVIFIVPDLAVPPDLSAALPLPKPHDSGCEMTPGGGAAATFFGALGLSLALLLLARRRRA